MHDRRAIRAERQTGTGIRQLARDFGASRNAVRRALAADARLDYERPSMSEEFEPAVRDVLADHPRLSVVQVGEIVEWPGSRRTLTDLVARVRPTVLEREREDLNRPAMGVAAAGTMRVGVMSVGSLTVGSVNHGSVHDDPRRAS